jgi:hypothetical protein
MALYPNDQGNDAGAIPVRMVSGGGNGSSITTAGPAEAGVSTSGTVGTTSGTIVAAGAYKGWVTIQNTHASNVLYVSFKAAATATDFAIYPNSALTLPFGPTNALSGLGSGAGTTFATIGY